MKKIIITLITLISFFWINQTFAWNESTWAIIETEKILSSIITWTYTWTINYTYSWSQIISSEVNITSYLEEQKIDYSVENKVYIYIITIINMLLIITLYLSPYILAYMLAKKNFLNYNQI